MGKALERETWRSLAGISSLLFLTSCAVTGSPPRIGDHAPRIGDEIMIGGELFHTGTPVVLWFDPEGYDAYRSQCWDQPGEILPRFPARGCDTPNRYSLSGRAGLDSTGIDLPGLRRVIRQFVLHYDAAGSARRCFHIIHDLRGLSVHFLLDLDGTIYQTLDLKERARHAGEANDRSVGVEIAHPGYLTPSTEKLYATDGEGLFFRPPPTLGASGLRSFVAHPRTAEIVSGTINGGSYRQYDFTAEQYAALAKLSLCLERVLGIPARPPRDEDGSVLANALSPDDLRQFEGILGHWHVTARKVDPGPAFDWDFLVESIDTLRNLR